MIVLGLTGSIAMGKSSAAIMFRRMGVALYDADRTVHELTGPGGAALAPIEEAFPGVVDARGVDRQALGARVFGDPEALARLEGILHPMARRAALSFLKRQRMRRNASRGKRLVVLDIPLLFETQAETLCDAVMMVTAPAFLQEARALARPGMTPEKLAAVRGRQMPENEKRRRADFIVQTGLDKGYTFRRIRKIVRDLLESRKQV